MATTNEKLDISVLPPASRRELLSYYQYLLERRPAKKSSRQKNKSFSELCGKLTWDGDAVAAQRKLRDAIIAATATVNDAVLITNDSHFATAPALIIQNC